MTNAAGTDPDQSYHFCRNLFIGIFPVDCGYDPLFVQLGPCQDPAVR